MRLTEEQRNSVDRAVSSLRALFESEFEEIAGGRFGLHTTPRGGTQIEDESALSLSPTEAIQRAELLGAVDYLVQQGATEGEAIARLIREAAFTVVNQLLAVRVAEGVGVFPQVLSAGRDSQLYRDLTRDLFPLLATEESSFWTYLQVCGDELGPAVPLLFDRRLPVHAFSPSAPALNQALELFNADDVTAAWQEPEALGWAYQFFNAEDERREMRAAGAPRNSRELAIRNQFFTPGYVVDWLVQNTLGLRLREAGFELDLPLPIEEVTKQKPLDLAEVGVLDPACGSGHFLLGAYELLEQAWASAGVDPAEAAPRILGCLFGIEIDPRASQVAQVVLTLRARMVSPTSELPAPAIVTARDFPELSGALSGAFSDAPESVQDLARELAEALDQAPVLGPLLKVEERLRAGVKRRFGAPTLGDRPKDKESASSLEQQILNLLHEGARMTDASPAERMFAAEGSDAVRFVEFCLRRYDAVLMNPPFGDAVPETVDYLKAAYPMSASDLATVFVERGMELLAEDGRLGAITTRAPFFLKTFEAWRSELALPRLHAFLDLGVGVMHEAMVQAVAYTLGRTAHRQDATFRRLLDEPDKDAAVRAGPQPDDTYVRRPADFLEIPGAPAAYWLGEGVIALFRADQGLEDDPDISARRGPDPGDNLRFVRFWWEVGRSGALGTSARWITYAKGGTYSPYWADLLLVVDWDYENGTFTGYTGRRGRSSPIPENRSHFGRPGLSWTRRSQKGFSVRIMPAGAIFGERGPSVFVEGDSQIRLCQVLAFLNSTVSASAIESLVTFGSFEVGAVQRLPYIDAGEKAGELARQITETRMHEDEVRETSHLFYSPWADLPDFSGLARLSEQVDEAVATAAGIEEANPLSGTYPTKWFREEYEPPGPPELEDEISYLLGAALGRWDIRTGAGLTDPEALPDPFDPLPATSRGMLRGEDGAHPADASKGYPLELPTNGILHDDRGHALDVVAAMERAADVVESGPLGPSSLAIRQVDLRRQLRERFFRQHVGRYSGSNRKAPIYWHLAVPSGSWGIWLYAPRLSREMLFAIAGAAAEKLRATRDQARHLRERSSAESSREERERLEGVEALVAELEVFHRVAEGIANSRWSPDLNDGVVLCASPLRDLFVERRWRDELDKHRSKLQAGEYPWASVQDQFYEGEG